MGNDGCRQILRRFFFSSRRRHTRWNCDWSSDRVLFRSAFFYAQDSLRTEVNGQSGLANNLQFEGVDDNERTGLLQVYIPPIEAIQTVDVTTSSYDAELRSEERRVGKECRARWLQYREEK